MGDCAHKPCSEGVQLGLKQRFSRFRCVQTSRAVRFTLRHL